jgi:endonuclease III
VKSGVADPAKLKALLKKLGSHEPIPSAGEGDTGYDEPIAVIVFSFLLWEATTQQAQDAMAKIVDSIVDFNELRVCLPNEVVSIIGSRYPNSMERARRMKRTLHAIYMANHAVSLDSLQSSGKREVRAFIEALDGIPPFVASWVLQRCYDVHAIPVDDRLVDLFIEKGVLAEISDPDEVSKWLSRQVKSSDGRKVEAALRSFVDSSPKPTRKAPPKSKPVSSSKKEAPAASTAKEEPAKKAAKKAPEKKVAKKPAKKAAGKAPAKKVAKKTAKKAPAKKAAKKAPEKKVAKKPAKKVAKKATAKKTTKKAPAKKSARKSVR